MAVHPSCPTKLTCALLWNSTSGQSRTALDTCPFAQFRIYAIQVLTFSSISPRLPQILFRPAVTIFLMPIRCRAPWHHKPRHHSNLWQHIAGHIKRTLWTYRVHPTLIPRNNRNPLDHVPGRSLRSPYHTQLPTRLFEMRQLRALID